MEAMGFDSHKPLREDIGMFIFLRSENFTKLAIGSQAINFALNNCSDNIVEKFDKRRKMLLMNGANVEHLMQLFDQKLVK